MIYFLLEKVIRCAQMSGVETGDTRIDEKEGYFILQNMLVKSCKTMLNTSINLY